MLRLALRHKIFVMRLDIVNSPRQVPSLKFRLSKVPESDFGLRLFSRGLDNDLVLCFESVEQSLKLRYRWRMMGRKRITVGCILSIVVDRDFYPDLTYRAFNAALISFFFFRPIILCVFLIALTVKKILDFHLPEALSLLRYGWHLLFFNRLFCGLRLGLMWWSKLLSIVKVIIPMRG